MAAPKSKAEADAAGTAATVNVHQAKTHLSRLLKRVEAGEEIVLARAGKPVAKIVPFVPTRPKLPAFGTLAGEVWIADDFDGPLPDDLLDLFYE